MTSNFRKTSQACGSMSQFRLSSIADQALHVCSSTSTHAHSHQALHSTSKRSRLRAYVKGNSSFHFNLSHSMANLRRRGFRTDASRPDPTSGHSHPSPKPDHLTAEAFFVLTLSSFNSIHVLTSFNPHHKRTFLTDLQKHIQFIPRMRSSS